MTMAAARNPAIPVSASATKAKLVRPVPDENHQTQEYRQHGDPGALDPTAPAGGILQMKDIADMIFAPLLGGILGASLPG